MGKNPDRKSRRGRPRRKDPEATLAPMVFRPSAETRNKVVAAAEASERSLSAELERRLLASFATESDHRTELARQFGGELNYALGFAVARLAASVSNTEQAQWHDDEATFAILCRAVALLLVDIAASRHYQPDVYLTAPDGPKVTVEVKAAASAVGDLRKALESPRDIYWWPLGDGTSAQSEEATNLRPDLHVLRRLLGSKAVPE